MKLLITGGRIIDPSEGVDSIGDILIDGGVIKEVTLRGNGAKKAQHPKGIDELDATGLVVAPGFIDMHTHLREPGFEYKETIATGTLAAARGGFTAVCAMPNTNPPNDNTGITEYILHEAESRGHCTVYPIGAITKKQRGEELAEMGMMRDAGCVAFSDDGVPVMNSNVMRRALEYSKAFKTVIISHAEDINLSSGGVMNAGLLSARLGLGGIPAAAEEIMTFRDILLSELTGGHLHIAHISTEGSVRIIRDAKSRGARVTAETCPHYFSITEDAVMGYNTNAKVNPPLRTQKDVEAIREGLADGTLDVIATDHAPHGREEKTSEFDNAPSGISGLETAVSLSLALVHEGVITINNMIRKFTVVPAGILGLDAGTLRSGSAADITIIDTGAEVSVDAASFVSKGKNTPFDGWKLKGAPVITICGGKVNRWR